MEEDVRNAGKIAETVWLLMGREYRISRSIRLQWFFQHLNSVVSRKKDEEIVNSSEELEVLSVLPSLKKLPTSEEDYGPLMITPTTRLSFVGRQYRFVFCIDMSPSLATVDTESGNVLFDEMFMNLHNAFTGLVQPFCIPGSSLVLKPRLHVTVIAHNYIHVKDCQVLVQGYCVNEGNVKYFLCQLKRKIQVLEKSIAEEIGNRNKEELLNGERPGSKRSETSLFYIIRDGLFALQLLPDNASAAIVVVTDGVFQFENAHISDALLQQVRHLAAVCSFLQVGTGFHKSSVEFGYVPHCALMQFIATATSGAYLANCPRVGKIEDYEMNMYHRALFCWNFQRDIDRDKVDSYQDTTKTLLYLSSWADCSTCLTPTQKDVSVTLPPQPIQTTNYNESTLCTNITSVLTVRSREGYITDAVRITKGKINDEKNKQIEVKLVLPWKEHVTIEYIAKSSWPFDSSSYFTNIIVNVSGPYEFLVDITSTRPKNHKQLRKITLDRFEQTMKSLEASDHLLEQLQCFPTHAAAAKIPETVAKGSPLFCITPTSNIPVLTLQYGSSKTKKSSKSPESQFASYWKPVVTMDTRTWSKWFHCHRISILPEHDRPIPSNLMVPVSPDHYPSIHCRASLSALFCLLKEWCSFILLENHSYVKFMSRSPQERPNTFCLLRLNFKGLCIVLRLGFLGGTPGKERSKVFEDLKSHLAKLTAHLTKVVRDESSESLFKSPIKESPCVIFLTKQFERILVKYDAIPDEIRREQDKDASHGKSEKKGLDPNTTLQQSNAPQATASVLFQYLFNQRWIWEMGPNPNATLEEHSIAEILETIIMQRLHEGFHFCSYNKGIITMVKEVQVMVDSSEDNLSNCSVIQYVIFPPHTQIATKGFIHDDSVESDNIHEVEGSFQMVAEIWVEPQLGTMDVPNSPLDYIHGYEYNKIPEKVFSVDAQIVQEIESYMLIHKACYDRSIFNEFPSTDVVLPVIPSNIYQAASTIRIPFLFQILPLLKKSRLIVSMYPMMKHMPQENLPQNSSDQNDIFLIHLESTLRHMNDHKVCLHQSESANIYKFIKERCTQNNMRVWNHEENAPVFKQHSEDVIIEFNCFMKSFGSLIVIMFSPATVHDLNLLLECSDESLQAQLKNNRDSIKSDDEFIGRTHMPFFIFECEFRRVKAVPSMYASFDQDVVQDYTQVLNESALTPRHLNQKLPNDRSREIAMFCQALYDHYFWSLVSAVYHCLESGYVLDPEDVELSIELVCEESIHEIDITEFIRNICSHYRSNTFSNEIFVPEDIVFPEGSVLSSPFENKPLSRLKKRSSSGSSSLRSSKNSLKSKPKECENFALQEEIKLQFLKILEQNFVSVPNDPYHMFFSNSTLDHDIGSDIDDLQLSSARSSVSQADTNYEDVESVSTSGPESDNQLDDVEIIATEHKTCNDILRPMFLHLTCSCHYKSNTGNSIRPISVTTLPTCLSDILFKLDDNGRSIDPYNPSLSITLDLICLTQPTEPEEGPEWKTPKVILKRQNSSGSFYSTQSEESTRTKRQRFLSQVSQGESYIRSDINPLEILPIRQREAMEKTIKQIDWLLEDEISSALRNLGLVTEDNLNKVATHVENSIGFENCIFEKRYFMFVTGIEKASNLCLPLFICELESARLDRYHLSRVGKYYCLVLNSHVDDESDVESIMTEDIKEKARSLRKTYGHRRSQSDFINNRQHTIDLINLTENINHISKSQSLPILYPWMFGDSDASSQFTDTIDVLERNSNKSSSTSSSLSMNTGNERMYVQRANSYGAKDMKGSNAVTKRRYSMPNIHVSFSVDASGSGTDVDDSKEMDKTTGVSIVLDDGVCEQTECDEDDLQPHPDFWLFSHISEESVDVYFHRRHADSVKNLSHHQSIYNRLLQVMDQICKIVNQRILLENLYSTNQCHNLLVAEDDDQVWDMQDHHERDILFINEGESTNQPFGTVIHGEYKFKPGYFECEMVWQKLIPIHTRLAVSNMVGGISKGLGAVRNALIQFRVSNRQNLFVIKENESKNVFYFRVTAGSKTEHGLSTMVSPTYDDEHLFAPVREDLNQPSRASSYSSLNHRPEDNRFNKFEFERQESCQSGQFFSKNEDHTSLSEVSSLYQHSQECVVLSVYGIREPGKEIKNDMVNMITKRLDVTILALINQSLERNPKCKLSPQDVEFIQPIGQLPSKIFRLCVSNYAARYLHAAVFYLQQHLLQSYNSPRFTVTNDELHFKNYAPDKQSALSASPISSNDLLLYNRSEPAGNGVGIVYFNLVDQDGSNIVVNPYYPHMIYDSAPLVEQNEMFEKLTQIQKIEEIADEDTEMCRNILIEFKIWERGNIMLEVFEKELLKNLQYALCDVFLEYHLLCTPLCFIPSNLQSSVHSSRRGSVVQHSSYNHVRNSTHSSCSSNATTPKLIKSHLPPKKFFSEPTTPNDLRSESPASKLAAQTKDDLSLVSESPNSYPNKSDATAEICTEIYTEEVEKRRTVFRQFKGDTSPVISKKKVSREESPLLRKRSTSSRTSSVHSENDSPSQECNKPPKTISMTELKQLKLPAGTSYVLLTDAEVQESLTAVEGSSDRKTSTWQEREIQRRLELDNQKEKRKHEHGLLGELHSNYYECADKLFDYVIKHGARSLRKQTGRLTHQYSVDAVMKEFMKEMKDKCPDITPKIYKHVEKHMDGVVTIAYRRYEERNAVKPEQDGETSMDLHKNQQHSLIPGQNQKYIILGHNAHKWLLSMGTNEADLSDNEEGKTMIEEQSKQRFSPFLLTNLGSSGSESRRKQHDTLPPSCIVHSFVPRQKFFMAVFDNREISLYTYNFPSDVMIGKQFSKLCAWYNVRSHLNACLFLQKLGLYHHKHFVRDCPGKEDADVSHFSSSSTRTHVEGLMKHVCPKTKEKNKPDSEHSIHGLKIPEFDEIFRDTCPSKTLHQSPYFSLKDLVKRQFYQYQNVRNIKLSAAHKEARLKEIYDGWKQEGAHVPVVEERLNFLKKNSLFIHYCDAPVMFQINEEESDSFEQEAFGKEVGCFEENDGIRMKGHGWYEELKWMLAQQYIQYLQTLGLCVVQVNSKSSSLHVNRSHQVGNKTRNASSRSSRISNRSSDGKDVVMPDDRPSCYYLQKTSTGGIILVEVHFKKDFLCYEMFAFDSSTLPGNHINSKDHKYFKEDCNKFKDLTHLRSFSYDFHLRQLQDHLSGRRSVFQKGYPVHKLMEKIIQVYPQAPKFCRCVLADGIVSLPCTPGIHPQTLFTYLISNSPDYKLSKISVSTPTLNETDTLNPKDFILVFNFSAQKQPIQFPEGWRIRRDVTEYDGTATVHFDNVANTDVISVPFFLVLRNKKEFYPRPHMLSSVSSLKRRQRTQSGMDFAGGEIEIVKQKVRVRFSGPDESQEHIISQVKSDGNLRRMPSWSQVLNEGKSRLESTRSTGSDTSLSSRTNRSPVKLNILSNSPDQHGCGSPDSDVSTNENTRSMSASTQENFLLNEQKFLLEQICDIRNKLCRKMAKCLSNCWRDLAWLSILQDDVISVSKKNKKKAHVTFQQDVLTTINKNISEWKMENSLSLLSCQPSQNISFNSIKELITLVTCYRLSAVDNRISDSYVFIKPVIQQQVLRTLQGKFGSMCRQFLSDDGDVTYFCILNPGNLDMFFLIEANEINNCMDFSIVYRRPPRSKSFECKEEISLKQLERISRTHIEHVVTCLCFNLWQQMLPI